MNGQLPAIVPRGDLAAIEVLDATARQAVAARSGEVGLFRRSLTIAAAIQSLRELLSEDLMRGIMALQGSPLGFLTDKDKDKTKPDGKGPGYPLAVVRDCVIEATIRGFRHTGNEWNIIGGRFYPTQAGVVRQVLEWPGLTDLADAYDLPETRKGVVVVPCRATWKLDGRQDGVDCSGPAAIPVRVNEGMGVEAVLGKAKRKLHARILTKLSRDVLADADDAIDVEPTVPVEDQSQEPPQLDLPDAETRELARQARLDEYRDLLRHTEAVPALRQLQSAARGDEALSEEDRAKVSDAFRRKAEKLGGKAVRQQSMVDGGPRPATEEGM